jgi:hypothetical protein
LRRLGASRCGWPNLGPLALGLALDLLISLTGDLKWKQFHWPQSCPSAV